VPKFRDSILPRVRAQLQMNRSLRATGSRRISQ
jgi:hypothetical protein